MSLLSERYKADRMKKSSSGALPVAGTQVTKKFPSGMRFFENGVGGMRRARSSPNRRRKRVSAIVLTSKLGWTCMTPKKEERRLAPKSRDASFAMKLRSIYRLCILQFTFTCAIAGESPAPVGDGSHDFDFL